MNDTLFIVDGLNYLYRAFHALPPLTTRGGMPTGAVYGFCQMLLRIDREYRPSHACLVFDAPGPTFRDALYKEYKANRPPTPPELIAQIGLAHRVSAAFGFPVLSIPGVEADDVIATLTRCARSENLAVVIGSSDKDLMQLCTRDVSLLDTMKNRLQGPAEVRERWGVLPDQLGDLLALMGDTVDNVPGVPGIGPKTAAELLLRYGSLDGVLANTDKIQGKKGQALAKAKETLALSRLLVRLRDDVALPLTVADLQRCAAPEDALRSILLELEFGRLLAHVPPSAPREDRAAAPTEAEKSLEPIAKIVEADTISPGSPPEIVTSLPALVGVVDMVCQAGECGIAVLCDAESGIRAGLVGIAIALPEGRCFYIPLGQRLLATVAVLPEREVLSALSAILARDDVHKHVYDAKSIEVLLRVRGRNWAGLVNDAMLAGYVLDAASADFTLPTLAAQAHLPDVVPRSAWLGTGRTMRAAVEIEVDVAAKHIAAEACAALKLSRIQGERLREAGQEHLFREVELPLIPVLATMECWGIRLDCNYLRSLGNEVARSALALETEIHRDAGTAFNIASPKQLAHVLFEQLGLPIIRKTKTGASTDADVLEELAALHPVVAKVLEYRTLTKLKGTYIDALPALVSTTTGRLHTTFHQTVAATGRLSSSDPNLQNIPIRSEVGRMIRNAFVADPGFLLVSADYSQIELRVLAHFSEDPAFLEAFRTGVDIHRRTAAEIFGVTEAEVSAEQRRVAKAINFGLVFGQTDFGLAQALRIPRAQARMYIESYFRRYARVREFTDEMVAEAKRTAKVSTLLGRTRQLPEINAKMPQARNYAERIARNTPIQGSAADILKLAMLRVARGLPRFPAVRLLLTVHDELVLEVPEGEVDSVSVWVKQEMESAYALRVPLVVDVRAGRSWGEAH